MPNLAACAALIQVPVAESKTFDPGHTPVAAGLFGATHLFVYGLRTFLPEQPVAVFVTAFTVLAFCTAA
jgi:hypothetical protein